MDDTAVSKSSSNNAKFELAQQQGHHYRGSLVERTTTQHHHHHHHQSQRLFPLRERTSSKDDFEYDNEPEILLAGNSYEQQHERFQRERLPFLSTLRGGGGNLRRGKKSAAAASSSKTANAQSSLLGGGKASMAASIFNLVNNVAGAGILALSAGQAAGTGWIPSILMCGALGVLSSRTFIMVGEACEMLQEADFKGLWKRTMGEKSTYLVDTMIAILCLAVAVIYAGILGDVFTPLLAEAGLPDRFNSRSSNIIALTISLLLPMSLIRDLSSLAFTSILGFSAIMYTVFFVVVRALDGTYSLGSGKFVTDGALSLMPAFERTSWWTVDFTSLVLASNLGLAYVAHYNAPSFYKELKNTNSKRFGTMVKSSFVLLVLLYAVTMAAGYSTFGDVCQGNLLLNYHPRDFLSTLGRVATGCSILFGFPLVATGARESLVGAADSLGLLSTNALQSLRHSFLPHFFLVASILTFCTSIACTVQDVSLVVGLTGAALGSFIVYICPSIIYTRAVALKHGKDSPAHKRAQRWSLPFIPLGLFLGAFGAYMTLKEAGGAVAASATEAASEAVKVATEAVKATAASAASAAENVVKGVDTAATMAGEAAILAAATVAATSNPTDSPVSGSSATSAPSEAAATP